jgi:hypothetical protein
MTRKLFQRIVTPLKSGAHPPSRNATARQGHRDSDGLLRRILKQVRNDNLFDVCDASFCICKNWIPRTITHAKTCFARNPISRDDGALEIVALLR